MSVDTAKLRELRKTLELTKQRKRFRKIEFFEPNPKQALFFALSRTHDEIMLRAGNQLGKSEAGACATACHLTGLYPPDWKGRKFKHPIRAWAAGLTATEVRNIQQTKLCGPYGVDEDLGTGFIPKDCFVQKPLSSRSAPDAFDTIYVQHYTNGVKDGISTLQFKSYERGKKTFQGEPVHLIWLDEEDELHGIAIYTECQARCTTTSGLILVTFTPLNGRTKLVIYFEEQDDLKAMVKMNINDATHLSEEDKIKAIGRYRNSHERDARLYGDPLLGSGAIFDTHDSLIRFSPGNHTVPLDWRKLWGIDFGIDHPFAAVLGAIDDKTDTLYLLHGFKMAEATKIQHIPAMRAVGAGVPVAWPHDMGKRTEVGEGNLQQLAAQYREPSPGMPGLQMLSKHSTWPDGSISTQAAIDEMDLMLRTNRFKVADTLEMEPWFDEYRNYHRKDGKLVRLNDDMLSATFKILMMKRFARAVPLGARQAVPANQRSKKIAEGCDSEHWGID